MTLLEKLKNKRVYAIFHNDLDGVMSRVIYEKFCKNTTSQSTSVNITNSCDTVDNVIIDDSEVVLFTDVTPTLELLEYIQTKNKKIIICDHHIQSYEKLKNIIDPDDYYFTIEKCGTKILFDEVRPKRAKPIYAQVVHLTDIYDRWQYKHDSWSEAFKLQACLFEGLPWRSIIINGTDPTIYFKPFISDMLIRFSYFDTWVFSAKDEIKVQSFKDKIQKAYKKANKTMKKRVDTLGRTYIFFESIGKLSFVSHRLLNENANIAYIVSYSTFDPSLFKLSLRASDMSDINVGQIASDWEKDERVVSAGGHEKASGIQFSDRSIFDKICKGEVHLA